MGLTSGRLQRVRRSLRGVVDPDDPTSIDPELVQLLAPSVDRLCRRWYRLEVRDRHLLPKGAALVVGNHNSGAMFFEALGVPARLYVEEGLDELWHGLVHDTLFRVPGVGRTLARLGGLRAGHDAAGQAFARGRKVLVFPGGNIEAFRTWRRRHEVDFAGRTGWLALALRHQVPIVPTVFIGGHEGFVVLTEGRRLARRLWIARRLRCNTWPLVVGLPWGVSLGPYVHLPLPTKCVTRFLPPVTLDGLGPDDADDPAVLARLYAQVTDTMQAALTELAAERRYPLLG